jgi:LCP family protein required for cell wall assembly
MGATVAVILPSPVLPARTLTPSEQAAFRDDSSREQQLDRSLNILVLGTDVPDPTADKNSWAQALEGRSDTLLLARFDPDESTINLLSIPRDTRVIIPGHGLRKINDANAIGGPSLAARVVSTLLGDVPIDRYLRLNTYGVARLIDAVGGVEVNVPVPMHYTDRTQNLTINLEPGLQKLDGDRAHQFIRFRQDALGDIGRVQRQQIVMRALSKQLLHPMTLTRLPGIMQAIRDNADTNLTWNELFALSRFAVGAGEDHFRMVMLPGRFSQPGESIASYWIANPEEAYRLAVTYFDATPTYGNIREPSPAQQHIAVQNASGSPSMARNMAVNLQQKGFTNTYLLADSAEKLAVTQIVAQRGDVQAATEVQALLGLGEVRVQSTGDLESDITIRVGRDWVKVWFPDGNEGQKPPQPSIEARRP